MDLPPIHLTKTPCLPCLFLSNVLLEVIKKPRQPQPPLFTNGTPRLRFFVKRRVSLLAPGIVHRSVRYFPEAARPVHQKLTSCRCVSVCAVARKKKGDQVKVFIGIARGCETCSIPLPPVSLRNQELCSLLRHPPPALCRRRRSLMLTTRQSQ